MATLTIILATLLACRHSTAQRCSQSAQPQRFIMQQTSLESYSGKLVNYLDKPGCSPSNVRYVQCDYSVVLGDGVMVPSPPDLNNDNYLGHFIALKRDVQLPHIDFDFTEALNGITAIELSFLNSPTNRVSLPGVTLSEVQYGSFFDEDVLSFVPSRLLDNQDLSQTDNQIRRVTIQPHTAQAGVVLRINVEFKEYHDFDWTFLSEVQFCTDLPFTAPTILFQPLPNITQPSADDLRGGSTELVCTVSSQGSYTWQWKKDNSVIGNGDPNYDITIGDGSRTTKLMISNLDFSDAGRYNCSATNGTSTKSLAQTLEFPEQIVIVSDINQEMEEATLTCELHGYQSSFSPPVWLNMNGSEIATSDKYTISSSNGVNTIVLENGTTLPSVLVSLTIHKLTTADEGDYTCHGTRGESVIRLTTAEAAATHPSSPTHSSHGKETSAISGLSLIVALVILVFATVATILSLVIVIIFQLHKAKKLSVALDRLKAANLHHQNDTATSSTTGDYETIREIATASTTLSRNITFQQRNDQLPLANENVREQYPQNFGPMIEIDSDDDGILQREPSDYLMAVSSRCNILGTEGAVEDSELEQRNGGPERINFFLMPSEEVYLHWDRESGSYQEEGEELQEQRRYSEQTEYDC